MSDIQKPEGVAASYTVTQATECYNYIGETNMYFFTESSGQFTFSVKDDGLKQQIWNAFENPTQFKCYVFHTGSTVNAIQVRADL